MDDLIVEARGDLIWDLQQRQASSPPLDYLQLTKDQMGRMERLLDNQNRERLAAFKVPATFVAIHELPRTASGKVQKFKLSAEFASTPFASGSLRAP